VRAGILFHSFYVRVGTMTAIWTVGHRLRSTPTNGHRFTALSLPWRSPIQVPTELGNDCCLHNGSINVLLWQMRADPAWSVFVLFVLQSTQVLLKVALLYDEHRHHFVINNDANTNCQLVEGTSLRSTRATSTNEYYVQVDFTGGLFGVFTQTVVFDFGCRPVLARKLKVELGHKTDLDAVSGLCKKLQFDRL